MTEFKAKNNQPTFYQMFYRSKYSKEAFLANNGLGEPGIVDFLFAERNLYGRVDQNLNVVVPSVDHIKRISSRDNPSGIVGMNFVVDQFKDFVEVYDRSLTSNKIKQDEPFLSKIRVYKSYINPKQLYEEYLADIIENFENIFLDKRQVIDIKDYFREFLAYAELIAETYPITYTAWQRSRNSSIYTSGLALDLSGQDVGNDEFKERFINSENFPFFQNVCNNYGFSISKNCPWVIVADLGSPASLVYHESYGLSSVNEIFSEQYIQTHLMDIDYIKINLYRYYNSLVDRFGYEKQFDYCKSKIIKTNIFRNNITIEEYNNTINNLYLLEYYNNIRNIEENYIFSQPDKMRITQNAKNLQKTFDNSRAISYINEQYRSVYKSKPGGLNDVLKKTRTKKAIENKG